MADKDIFILSFKNYLARRLLSERSESIQLERQIVTKLKVNCGRQFTDSIEGMMNDLEMARELRQKYTEQFSEKLPIDFDIKVLTSSYWPTYKSFELSVPQEINDCMQSFETYYKAVQTNHHKELKWNFSMGTCVLTCKIPGATKTYELIVSAYQMCILYLFKR